MKPFRIIEHTADIGIHVTGSSLKELFKNAAFGMVDLFVEGGIPAASETCVPQEVETIKLKADIMEQLLVKWLEELLFLFETRHLVPVSLDIKEFGVKNLTAEVALIPFDSEVHKPRYQIKAVTYHNLVIKKEKGRFQTRIIFDI